MKKSRVMAVPVATVSNFNHRDNCVRIGTLRGLGGHLVGLVTVLWHNR